MAHVLWHVTMSLDGFIAGPKDSMDWMLGFDFDGENEEGDRIFKQIGAVLSGRHTYDVGVHQGRPEFRGVYGGRWTGPTFVLTHNPPADSSVTFLSGDIQTAVETAGKAAGDRQVVILGANVARQCIEAELLDEIAIHMAPVLLGDGVRLFNRPNGDLVRLELAGVTRFRQLTNLRFWVVG